MKLDEIYSKKDLKSNIFFDSKIPPISFEVFPPKNDLDGKKLKNLLAELEILMQYNPKLISITYGAGGTARDNTFLVANSIKKFFNCDCMPHFTCINSSLTFVQDYIKQIISSGFENILALKGDLPQDIKHNQQHFNFAYELIDFIYTNTNLSIAAAGYPEKHPLSVSVKDDLDNLKRKVDLGASVIYTQLFFDNTHFFRYLELVRKNNINVPIVAGILPVISLDQINKMVKMCNASIPDSLLSKLAKCNNNLEDMMEVGINFATLQVEELINFGVDGLHFYTLNKSYSTKRILECI